jgi:hypothetical protein
MFRQELLLTKDQYQDNVLTQPENNQNEKNKKSSSETSVTSEPSDPPESQISYVQKYERLTSFH